MKAIFGMLLLSCCAVGVAEQPTPDYEEQFLQEHHIAITNQAVTAALSDKDAGIRQAASHVLSSRWPEQAGPAIQQAMLREGDALVRIYLPDDLAELGNDAGRQRLKAECHNNENRSSTRIVAARSLIDLHDDSCDDAVLDVLRADSDPQDTLANVYALNLVPSFIHRSDSRGYQLVMDLTVEDLNDPDQQVRLTSATILGSLGDPSAIPALQVAVENEPDAKVRAAMLIELKKLMRVSAPVSDIVWS
jgi:HEAT repeat protein